MRGYNDRVPWHFARSRGSADCMNELHENVGSNNTNSCRVRNKGEDMTRIQWRSRPRLKTALSLALLGGAVAASPTAKAQANASNRLPGVQQTIATGRAHILVTEGEGQLFA